MQEKTDLSNTRKIGDSIIWKCPYCGTKEPPEYFESGYTLKWNTYIDKDGNLKVDYQQDYDTNTDSWDGDSYLMCVECGEEIVEVWLNDPTSQLYWTT